MLLHKTTDIKFNSWYRIYSVYILDLFNILIKILNYRYELKLKKTQILYKKFSKLIYKNSI